MAKEKRRELDNLLSVNTPENISFQYRIAGPFRRLFAFILDLLVLMLLAFLAFLIFIVLTMVTSIASPNAGGLVAGTMFGIILASAFFVFWFYTALMETFWNGQTFGKMSMRLRTLSSNGEAIDGVQALLRNFFRLIDVSPIISPFVIFGTGFSGPELLPTFMFGLIAMTLSKKYQRIGDLVAKTIVVHEQRSWSHGLATFDDSRVPQLADLIPQDFYVSSDLAKALASFADRRRYLPYQRVNEIAGHLARPILEKIGMPKDTNHDLLLCALYYKTYVSSVLDEDQIEDASSSEIVALQRLESAVAGKGN